VRENDSVEVFVNTRGLHFFDVDTRAAIWADDRAVAATATS
jgi:hypothetical protein